MTSLLDRTRKFFRVQIQEISDDRALRILGVGLALAQLATFVHFNQVNVIFSNATAIAPLCWPLIPDCRWVRFFSPEQIHFYLYTYCLVAVLAAYAFSCCRSVFAGYWLLAVSALLKGLFVLNDFRNLGNYHYMSQIAVCVFLLLPAKRAIYPLTIVAFYLGSSLLRFSPEWLTGQALYHDLGFGPAWLLPTLAAGVVLLEAVLSIALLSSVRSFAVPVFCAFCIFHALSYYWIGSLYPSVMACLLSFFPAEWLINRDFGYAGRQFLSGRLPRSGYIFLILFAGLQLYPRLLPGDSALTGQGRSFALDMMDARTQCHYAVLERFDRETIDRSFSFAENEPHIRCDPILFWNFVRNICWADHESPGFQNVDVFMISRRTSSPLYEPILSITNACENFQYNPILNNNWLSTNR